MAFSVYCLDIEINLAKVTLSSFLLQTQAVFEVSFFVGLN